MKKQNRDRIAYIAGRLITGKSIASLNDFDSLSHFEITGLPDADVLRGICCAYKGYVRGISGKYMCRYDFERNHAIDLRVNGSTFMGRITGSNAYFIGNVRGNMIHIYDREDQRHLNYRISACMVEHQVSNGGCLCSSITGAENATGPGD
jgi:hypothetical protein